MEPQRRHGRREQTGRLLRGGYPGTITIPRRTLASSDGAGVRGSFRATVQGPNSRQNFELLPFHEPSPFRVAPSPHRMGRGER